MTYDGDSFFGQWRWLFPLDMVVDLQATQPNVLVVGFTNSQQALVSTYGQTDENFDLWATHNSQGSQWKQLMTFLTPLVLLNLAKPCSNTTLEGEINMQTQGK